MELPDFLQLTDAERERENERQAQARRDFNSRAQMSPAYDAMARASIIEASLRDAMRQAIDPVEKRRIRSQLAENMAAQGRFREAGSLAPDADARREYLAIADAIFNEPEGCDCTPQYVTSGHKTIRIPRYTAVREVYSLKAGRPGFLLRCSQCGNLVFSDANPLEVAGNQSDLELLRS